MEYFLLIAFFLIAMVYASVGFGGGTSYLALMAVLGVSFEVMRPAALLCNIVVVTGGTLIFYRENLLDLRKIWPFLVFSVPMSFLGGYYPIRETTFFVILGVTLLVASVVLWFYDRSMDSPQWAKLKNPTMLAASIGGGIGFLSGLVSIGGGIFLSPLLHFMRWDGARNISALASVYILINSVSGLVGQWSRAATFDWSFIVPLLVAVFLGGQIGSRWGSKKFSAVHIRKITAVLIFIAGVNILINH